MAGLPLSADERQKHIESLAEQIQNVRGYSTARAIAEKVERAERIEKAAEEVLEWRLSLAEEREPGGNTAWSSGTPASGPPPRGALSPSVQTPYDEMREPPSSETRPAEPNS